MTTRRYQCLISHQARISASPTTCKKSMPESCTSPRGSSLARSAQTQSSSSRDGKRDFAPLISAIRARRSSSPCGPHNGGNEHRHQPLAWQGLRVSWDWKPSTAIGSTARNVERIHLPAHHLSRQPTSVQSKRWIFLGCKALTSIP